MFRIGELKTTVFVALISFVSFASIAQASPPTYTLTIKDHKFVPSTLEVPADLKFKLEVLNQDSTAEEFESYSLNREKIVTGNGKISMFVGPLKPGSYDFFGEFNPETAKGQILVK